MPDYAVFDIEQWNILGPYTQTQIDVKNGAD